MRKTSALWIMTLLAGLAVLPLAAFGANSARKMLNLGRVSSWDAPPQAAEGKKPQWKSREEYDAYNAMATEKDPNKKIALAEAFLKKYPDSDFKSGAYLTEMQSYVQLNQTEKAVDAAKDVLQTDPDNLDALAFLSYVFPFTFKADEPDATSKMSRAESDARHGLEVLQKLQKPDNVSQEQFEQYVKPKRAVFNNDIGFVQLQQKDYTAAITSFKAALQDNPSDVYTNYRLGLAYLYSSPPDYNDGIWYISRAVSLAKASNNPAEADIQKFLHRAYVNYHGNDEGLENIVSQSATSVSPPEGFTVEPLKPPEKTGNPIVDAFNQMTFPLKLGGERAQKAWDAMKGQPVELGGFVESVEKGTEPDTYIIRIDVTDEAKATEGTYDIELTDSTQSNVKNLSPGDPIRFKGNLTSYTASPSMVLSLTGTVNPDTIPAAPKAKPKPRPRRGR